LTTLTRSPARTTIFDTWTPPPIASPPITTWTTKTPTSSPASACPSPSSRPKRWPSPG